MKYSGVKKAVSRPLTGKNWESDVEQVCIEPCDVKQDPLGYCAVFYEKKKEGVAGFAKSFVIGASFLAQREKSLERAGYQAPMTQKAIGMIERNIGFCLSSSSMRVAA